MERSFDCDRVARLVLQSDPLKLLIFKRKPFDAVVNDEFIALTLTPLLSLIDADNVARLWLSVTAAPEEAFKLASSNDDVTSFTDVDG